MSWIRSLIKSHLPNTTAADPGGDPAAARLAARELADALPPGRVSFPGDGAYEAELRSYWSRALHGLRPACVVLPEAAADVAAAVRLLGRRHPRVALAVKSGGHDPNPGHAGVGAGGVLLSLARMAGAAYDAGDRCARVGPGGTWRRVVEDLEPHGVTVVGGRLGCVGVGGYLVQGGLSFLSAQYGLAADNIVGWETVRPDGPIVNVDAETEPELAKAMRGGGNQFGIVTQFRIKTHSIGKVWGGIRIYRKSRADALLSNLHDFIPAADQDPRAALIYSEFLTVVGSFILMHLFYDGPEPPSTGPFAELLKVPSVIDWTKSRTYSDLLRFTSIFPQMPLVVRRVSFRSLTIPYVPGRPGLYREVAAKWAELCRAGHVWRPRPLGAAAAARVASVCTLNLQPLPAAVGRRSEAAGGNAMGLSGADPDRLVVELHCGWRRAGEDAALGRVSRAMTDWLEERRPGWVDEARAARRRARAEARKGEGEGEGEQEDGEDEDARMGYMPLFMNDAMGDQDVTGSYREHERFRALQEKVDPEGMFRTRLGGFKF